MTRMLKGDHCRLSVYKQKKSSTHVVLQSESMESEKEQGVDKARKPGVVYLSRIPQSMNVKRIQTEMEKHGTTLNVYLEPDDKAPYHPYQRVYKEGWVEFQEKSVAKHVAATLNNTQVGGRRRHPWYDDIWNIKYLPKFQWAHLNARLAYERGVYKQRLHADILQIKREASFHKENFKKSHKLKDMSERKRKKGEDMQDTPTFTITQRETEEEILAKRRKHSEEGEEAGEGEGGKKKKKGGRRERRRKSNYRPDADHAVGALSLAANKELLHQLFGGGTQS